MAQIISKKSPIDLQPSRAVGFGFPVNGNAVFNPTYQTKDQIKANLVNYLLTDKGERYFNPNFGANLRNLLFSNITEETLDTLRARIKSEISNFFPSVQIKNIEFITNFNDNNLNFILNYSIEILGIEDSVDILIQ